MANFVEKENIFLKIAKFFFPWKGDKPVELIRKIIFLLSAIVLVVSLCSLISYEAGRAKDNRDNQDLSDLYHGGASQTVEADDGTSNIDLEIDTTKPDETVEEEAQILEEFIPLLEINDDIVGWITMGDEDAPFIDYVVVQGDDNDFYLDHNYKKESNIGGAIFADYREEISAKSEPANIILYGHNMASGEYFHKVTNYFNTKPGRDQTDLSFYERYPTFTFSTLYEKYTYKIFGGMLVHTEKKNGDVFYYLRGRNFETKTDFDEYIANILDRSSFYTDVDLQYGDHLITLSTCILDYGDWNMRWVLFGRRVREGEDPTVDVSKAYHNPDPLYFDAYYNYFGGSWGGRKWPSEMIYGYTG